MNNWDAAEEAFMWLVRGMIFIIMCFVALCVGFFGGSKKSGYW